MNKIKPFFCEVGRDCITSHATIIHCRFINFISIEFKGRQKGQGLQFLNSFQFKNKSDLFLGE